MSGLVTGQVQAGATVPAATRIRRRNRLINSCFECRRRKLKCDKDHPCLNCSRAHRECVFIGPTIDAASKSRLTAIKERVGTLERMLELDLVRGATTTSTDELLQGAALAPDPDGLEAARASEPEDEKDLEPTPWALSDAAYEDDADDEICDLGVRVGKMQVTERIGGYLRPKIAEELNYIEESSDDRGSFDGRSVSPDDGSLNSPSLDGLALRRAAPYVPSPGFLFGVGDGQTSLLDYLPTRTASDILIRQYFVAVHAVARVVHRPSFDAVYHRFWADLRAGIEPPASAQALVFAAMLSGAVSMTEAASLDDFGVGKDSMLANLRVGCEQALARAHFLRSVKLETLQAFVVYMIPMCRDQISRAHSSLTATAIRIAQCMGLHRDGQTYGLSPVELHVRRLIWHQLCFLDVRTCEAHGPHPVLREDDFDTPTPANLDDSELACRDPPSGRAERWTEMTLSLVRFECTAMMRHIWFERRRLEKRQITLTSLLSQIEGFRKTMEAKYVRYLDPQQPMQKMCGLILALLISRMFIMVLHRYHSVSNEDLPNRLRQIIITTGTEQLEIAMELEANSEFSRWSWYTGAYLQYHTALLLLIEVSTYPMRREADRMWRCLDYVFEVGPLLSRTEKARLIFNRIRHQSAAYHNLRKVRVPTTMRHPRGHVSNGSASPRHAASQSPPTSSSPSSHDAKVPDLRYEFTRTASASLYPPQQYYGLGASASTSTAVTATTSSTAAANSGACASPIHIKSSPQMDNLPEVWNAPRTINSGGNSMHFAHMNDMIPASSTNGIPDIDWNEWNNLFPPDVNNGQLDMMLS